jgi:hypothetical protein
MIPYGNKSRNSGVKAYSIGNTYIEIMFVDGTIYRYNNASAGANAIVAMKKLAKAGKGLSTYISQHVKDKYADKR